MMRTTILSAFLACGLALSAAAQTPAPPAAAPGPAKIAVISFEAAVGQTNEFQRQLADLQKKFEPQKTQLKSLSDEIDNLNKQLQAQADSLNESERASRNRTLEEKKKQAQRLADDAQNDFQRQLQEVFGSVATKVDGVLSAYAKQQGITLVMDTTQRQEQSPVVLYAKPSVDITKVVVEAYNAKSGISAPAAKPAAAVTKPTAKSTAPSH